MKKLKLGDKLSNLFHGVQKNDIKEQHITEYISSQLFNI